jgi:alpha-amylase/alpha-mannosidase (GH57 family)
VSALVLHGHFYQPPRENPWTGTVPVERSAAPFHDWNERIATECYRPNGWARVIDETGRIVAIVDNYEHLSFNIGPTLLSWLVEHRPEIYERIRAADQAQGRAIAQAYNHLILPLADDRDLLTQVRWGLIDFRHHFGRPADGMWLPETAVDDRVLAVLAAEGVGFTILAPGQASRVRASDAEEWTDVDADTLDVTQAYRWTDPENPEHGVDLIFYDGPLSHELAFTGVVSEKIVDRVQTIAPEDGLVCAATDGETFGHHHTFAERGVAYALAVEAPERGVTTPRLVD